MWVASEMPKFVGTPAKSLGRGGRLWRNARKTVLSRSSVCWICAGECPDFSWEGKLPFDSAVIDMSVAWPDPASPSVDHVIPIKRLAPDDPRLWQLDNLRPSHLRCNSARGDGCREDKVLVRTSRNWLA